MDVVPVTYAHNNAGGVVTLTTPATGVQIWTEGGCWIHPYSAADGAPSPPVASPAPAAGQPAVGWIHLQPADGVISIGFDPPPNLTPASESASVKATAKFAYFSIWSEVATGYLKFLPSRA